MTRSKFGAALTMAVMMMVMAGLAVPGAAQAQPLGERPSVIDPALVPPPGGHAMSGLDQEKLDTYRDRLETRQQENRMSGRDTTPGARRLDGALGRVDSALGR